jgi:hypothetical protein
MRLLKPHPQTKHTKFSLFLLRRRLAENMDSIIKQGMLAAIDLWVFEEFMI